MTGSALPQIPLGTISRRRAQLALRAQLLAGASVAYNAIEALLAISWGRAADSAALVGFGLDSTVEVASGLVILWQFRHQVPESREHTARRLIAVSFFALAAYVTADSLTALATGQRPDTAPLGIALAATSLAVMPLLSWTQRRTGRELGSGSVVADSTQTLLCTYLSAVLLLGLLANARPGGGGGEPAPALVIAAVAVREGLENWRGEDCCTPGILPPATTQDRCSDPGCDC